MPRGTVVLLLTADRTDTPDAPKTRSAGLTPSIGADPRIALETGQLSTIWADVLRSCCMIGMLVPAEVVHHRHLSDGAPILATTRIQRGRNIKDTAVTSIHRRKRRYAILSEPQ